MTITRICEICCTPFETDIYLIKNGFGKFCSQKCVGISQQKQNTHTCSFCGKEFSAAPSQKRKYCSQDCYWKSKQDRVSLVCDHCGKGFFTIPSEIIKSTSRGGKVRFCSNKCKYEHTRGSNHPSWTGDDPEYTCQHCGKIYTRPKTWTGGKIFCSAKCSWEHQRGNNAPNWQGGKTSEQDLIRKGNKYKTWRTAVFERDNYTCQKCGKKGGRLHAHHINPFSEYPEKRLDVNNGITLCIYCHNNLHPQNLIGLSASSPYPHRGS